MILVSAWANSTQHSCPQTLLYIRDLGHFSFLALIKRLTDFPSFAWKYVSWEHVSWSSTEQIMQNTKKLFWLWTDSHDVWIVSFSKKFSWGTTFLYCRHNGFIKVFAFCHFWVINRKVTVNCQGTWISYFLRNFHCCPGCPNDPNSKIQVLKCDL